MDLRALAVRFLNALHCSMVWFVTSHKLHPVAELEADKPEDAAPSDVTSSFSLQRSLTLSLSFLFGSGSYCEQY